MDVLIDELDRKILRTMQRDAGQSLDEIAQLPSTPVDIGFWVALATLEYPS